MAKCDLSIEFEEPEGVRRGGDVVRGTVTVRADADVRCNGLEIETCWKTHGRGNVAQGTSDTTIAFEGDWQAGQEYQYPFELACARWPPTYHGHYLNVDHYVEARAKIPWAFDPKASEPFQVRAVGGPDDQAESTAERTGCAGRVVGGVVGVIVVVVAGLILLNPFFWLLGALFALGSGVWWVVFRWMPARRLGPVEYQMHTERLAPGQQLRGTLRIQPQRDVAVNEIALTVSAVERCVSGSGSNRTTHRHTAFEHKEVLMPAGTVPGGRETQLGFAVPLPDEPFYSLELSDNHLEWSAELRVDIPRWPDWKQTDKFQVVPLAALDEGAAAGSASPSVAAATAPSDGAPEAPARPAAGAGEAITFDETMQHIWSVRDDEEQIELLIEAVRGLPFEISAQIERRLLYSSDEPAAYRDGYVVWAEYPDPPMPMTLYVRHALGDEFEQIGREVWQGRGAIVGYDRRHGRVRVEVEEARER